jgi:hypothetical protein
MEEWEIAQLVTSVISSLSNPTGDPNPGAALYGRRLRFIEGLKQKGATRLTGTSNGRYLTVAVVRVPELIKEQSVAPRKLTDFVIYTNLVGPTDVKAVFPDGHLEDLGGLASGQSSKSIEAGEIRGDPVLGAVWYRQASFDCESDWFVRALCAD